MWFRCLTLLALSSAAYCGELQEESEIKFAFYSSSWGGNTVDRIRVVAFNSTQQPVRLDRVTFLKQLQQGDPVTLQLNLEIPAGGYADRELEFVDLLLDDECIERTLAENWRLAEISNYTLNPSVRNLIIEDTDSFRIYQCVESVQTRWTRLSDSASTSKEEWVLFHFENRRDF